MGLDWIVISNRLAGKLLHPTDVLGSKRAGLDDPAVLAKMKEFWEESGSEQSFEDFADAAVNREVPPIVIRYGAGMEQAVPVFEAASQFYGYRAQSLLAGGNLLGDFAEDSGFDLACFYDGMNDELEIRDRITMLNRIVDDYCAEHPGLMDTGQNLIKLSPREIFAKMDEYASRSGDGDCEAEEDEELLYHLIAYLGAIRWLEFWEDKGFRIAADY